MTAGDRIFEYLSDDKVDEFVDTFGNVIDRALDEEDDEVDLQANDSFYRELKQEIEDYEDIGKGTLLRMERDYIGAIPTVSWNVPDAFEEVVKETYDKLGINYED